MIRHAWSARGVVLALALGPVGLLTGCAPADEVGAETRAGAADDPSDCTNLLGARQALHVATSGGDWQRGFTAGEQAQYDRAKEAMSQRRYEAVRPLLGELLAWDPPHVLVQFTAGYAAYELGENGEAVARFDDAFARAPELRAFSSGLGFTLWKMGRFDEARCAFEAALEADPQAYKARYGLGRVELSVGRLAEARAHLEAALVLEPSYRRARLNLARVAEEQDALDEALVLVEGVVSEWPSHEEALYLLARVLGRLGRSDDAERVLARREEAYAAREAIGGRLTEMRSGRDRPDLHAEIAAIYIRLGDLREARLSLQEGLARFPDDPVLRALRVDLPGMLDTARQPLPYRVGPANPVEPR